MTQYAPIRARYEMAIRDCLGPHGMVLHYDNVEEQPTPETGSTAEYATITISFPSSTEPDLCGGVVFIRGNVQINLYVPRMQGMRRLESIAGRRRLFVCLRLTTIQSRRVSVLSLEGFKDQHQFLVDKTHKLQW